MVRFRAWMALGLLLGAPGCIAPGRQVATRPYRPARAGLGSRELPGALTNQTPDGLGRYLVTVRAINTGGQSALKSLRFVITK